MIPGMSPGLEVRLCEARDAVSLDAHAWNALVEASPASTVFQTHEWFDTWWSAFGESRRLFLLSLHDGGAPAGLLALMRVHGPLGLRVLEFTGTPNADYQDFVLPGRRAEALRVLCDELHSARARWD